MKLLIKRVLKKIGVYYFLQGEYANAQFVAERNKNRKLFKKFAGQGFMCNNYGHSYSRFVPAPPLDENNPDPKKRTQKRLGMVIMNNFVFDGDDTWEDGTIYDPKNGKTYSCKAERDAKGNLDIRGYFGISLLGRTTHWTKVDYKEK